MSLVSMRQLLDHAAEFGYGLPAFNVNNLEQVQAIMEAAAETDSPVIMQASAGARKYAGEAFLRHLIDAAIDARNRQEEAQRLQAKAKAKSMAALLQRYPNASAHMAARILEAESVISRIREGYTRLEIVRNEQAINENEKAANNYIFTQRQELLTLHKRFDAELALLETLWKQKTEGTTTPSSGQSE